MSLLDRIPAGATFDDIEQAISNLSATEALALDQDLKFDWRLWARPEQRMPAGDWRTWLILGGRGAGKTRPGAETVREWARDRNAVIALIGPTAGDVRKVMIRGESGILNISPPDERPEYIPSIGELRWPSGALGFTYSAEEPERLRGPMHTAGWLDEIAAFPDLQAVWDLMIPGMRLGNNPRWVATTTPKPIPFLFELLADPSTVVTRMTTWANRANLPADLVALLETRYKGTRIGRQELEGEILDEVEGALWTRAVLDQYRVREVPELARIVIAIDPATTSGENSDECGIVAAGLGVDGHGYLLDDGTCRLPPAQWAARALSMYDKWNADKVIAETNNGGDLVESVLRTERRNVPYTKVTASRGKTSRAEPISALYQQGRIHHVGGDFKQLEDELCNFVPGKLTRSPNRADALVWAFSFLIPCKQIHQGRVLWM